MIFTTSGLFYFIFFYIYFFVVLNKKKNKNIRGQNISSVCVCNLSKFNKDDDDNLRLQDILMSLNPMIIFNDIISLPFPPCSVRLAVKLFNLQFNQRLYQALIKFNFLFIFIILYQNFFFAVESTEGKSLLYDE